MNVFDGPRAFRALARSGLLAPTRPDRLWRAGLALRHWGPTIAAAVAAGAARFGERVAIVDELGELTYHDLDARSNALARGMQACGVQADTVVGILCRNHRYFVDATIACSKLGAHALYLNTSFSTPQLRAVVERESARALVVDAEFAPLVDPSFSGAVITAFADADAGAPAHGTTVDALV